MGEASHGGHGGHGGGFGVGGRVDQGVRVDTVGFCARTREWGKHRTELSTYLSRPSACFADFIIDGSRR
jgi:hypothetical protein